MIKEKQEIKGNRNQSHCINKLIATLKKINTFYFILSIYLSVYVGYLQFLATISLWSIEPMSMYLLRNAMKKFKLQTLPEKYHVCKVFFYFNF